MPISMECPSCMNGFSVPNEWAGRKSKCPECQFALFVPRGETTVDPSTAVAPPAAPSVFDAKATVQISAEEIFNAAEEPAEVVAAAPAPSKKQRAIAKKTQATTTAKAPSADPFAFNDKATTVSRRRKSGGGAGLILLVVIALVALGGLVLVGAVGAAAWYLLSPAKTTTVAETTDKPAPKEEPRKSEPTAGDKEPPKDDPSKKEPPKDPNGKIIHDPIVNVPDPMGKPKTNPPPDKAARLTLSSIPPQTVKVGDKVSTAVTVDRENCQGPVTITTTTQNGGIRANAVILDEKSERGNVEVTVDTNVVPGTYTITVNATLTAASPLLDSKSFVLTVEKAAAPVVVTPPPADPAAGPLLIRPPAQVSVDGRPYLGHTGGVVSVSMSADKKWAISGGADGTVRLWELDNGKVATIYAGPVGANISTVTISPDGKWAASGDVQGSIRLYNLEKKEVKVLQTATKLPPASATKTTRVSALEFSPKSDVLASSSALNFASWDVATGKQIMLATGAANSPSLHYSPDGRDVFTISGPAMAIIDPRPNGGSTFLGMNDGKPTQFGATCFDGYWSRQELLAIVPKDKQGVLVRVNEKTGQSQKLVGFETANEVPLCVAVADKAGFALTADKDGLIRVWELDAGKELFKVPGHKGEVHALAVSADGRRFISGGDDGSFRVFDLTNGKGDAAKPPVNPPEPPKAEKTDKWEEKVVCQAHGAGSTFFIAASPDGKFIATGGKDHHVFIWDGATGKEVRNLGEVEAKGSEVAGVNFSADSKTLLVAYKGNGKLQYGHAVLFETAGWTVKQTLLNGLKEPIRIMAISNDGSRVLSVGTTNQVVIWDAVKGQPTRSFTHKSLTGTAVCALDAENQRVLFKGTDGRCHLLDMAKKEEIHSVVVHKDFEGVTFFPESKQAVTWGENGLQLRTVDLATGKASPVFKGNLVPISAAAVSADGKWIGTVSNITGTLQIWDVDTQQELFSGTVGDKTKPVAATSLCFLPDNGRIAVGGNDGKLRIYARAAMK